MKQMHLGLVNAMLYDFNLAGAPQRALLPLTGLRHESCARDAAEFNRAESFRLATHRALVARKDVMDALCDPSYWADDPVGSSLPIVKRMMSIVLLQARAGEYQKCIALLLQVLAREPLPTELDAKIATAERKVAEKLDGLKSKSFRLPEEERIPLQAAVLLLSQGATPPLPAVITTILSQLNERTIHVFSSMLSVVDRTRARPPFASGAQVLVWSQAHHTWENGIVRAARGRGLYEVSTPSIEARILPAMHVLRVAEGGAGSLLCEASLSGSLHLVNALIEGGVSVFEADARANTPLHFAVRRGDASICRRLLAANADAQVQNMQHITAWDLSRQCGQSAVRRLFSPSAADRDVAKPVRGRSASQLLVSSAIGDAAGVTTALDSFGYRDTLHDGTRRVNEVWSAGQITALMFASRRGDLDIVKVLLRAGADVGRSSKRMSTASAMAAEEGHTEVLHALLAAGAELDLPDDDGFTPLGIACENGHESATRALLDASSDPNYSRKNGWTHLITAAFNGYSKVAAALVEGGADPNIAKSNGYSGVIAASYNGFDNMLGVLVELGAVVDAPMMNGWNALMVACAQGHTAVVAKLCDARASVNYCRPSNGFSALMVAVVSTHSSTCAKILLQHHASVDLKDKHGTTALMHAAWHGHIASVDILLQVKATPTLARLGGTTPIMDAACGGHEFVISHLLEAKADADAADSHGFTALMHAARKGHDAAMLPLVRATMALNRKDKCNQSALDHASTTSAIDRLLKAGAEMSRDFRKRTHDAEMAAGIKGASKRIETPCVSCAGSTFGPSPPSASARAGRPRTTVSTDSKHEGVILRLESVATVDEQTVARESAARMIQSRFRIRHTSCNMPETRLFAMLQQIREQLPDHHSRAFGFSMQVNNSSHS